MKVGLSAWRSAYIAHRPVIFRISLQPFERAPYPLFQAHRRRPAKHLAGLRRVGQEPLDLATRGPGAFILEGRAQWPLHHLGDPVDQAPDLDLLSPADLAPSAARLR